ncbi:MAG: hypothetical protein ORN27_05785 [Rhodoluna sp.]|nr:hypothetical protein [Rhodoluna sp.]
MKKPAQLLVLVALTGAETLAVAVFLTIGIINILGGQERSLALSASLDALIAAFVIWGAFITKGLWQLKSWARSSSIFWQTAQLAIAYESFLGPTANPAIGWALIIPSLAVLALMFTNPLANLLKRDLEA